MPREKIPSRLIHSLSYKSFSPVDIKMYYKILTDNPNSLESLTDVALQTWLTRH